MPVLKRHDVHLGDAVIHPYPAWDVVVDAVGLQRTCDAQDRRAQKEARLWRELADEPASHDTSPDNAR